MLFTSDSFGHFGGKFHLSFHRLGQQISLSFAISIDAENLFFVLFCRKWRRNFPSTMKTFMNSKYVLSSFCQRSTRTNSSTHTPMTTAQLSNYKIFSTRWRTLCQSIEIDTNISEWKWIETTKAKQQNVLSVCKSKIRHLIVMDWMSSNWNVIGTFSVFHRPIVISEHYFIHMFFMPSRSKWNIIMVSLHELTIRIWRNARTTKIM